MRSNMTASMFDLSMKDKARTPFGKLKDKLKGKRGNGLPDTASAIIPSITRSPADSDEESNEKEKKKSKFKTLFSKPGLQKSSISQSMSVLPTLQPVSERVKLRPSDFQSQWSDDDDTLTPESEKPSTKRTEDNLLYPPSTMSHKRTGSADSKQLNQIVSSNTKKDTHSLFGGLKSKNDPASKSSVCINGSHVYMEECESKTDTFPRDYTLSSPSPQASRHKRLFLSQENLSSETRKDPEVTGRLPPDERPPEPSSLESFKAMTLPSYKLLSGGDFLESSTPVILDTPKEIKQENKKQENKKSLLSLVTGKKEAKASEEMENSADTSPKLKEAKHNERELAKKEVTPFGGSLDRQRETSSENSSAAADVPVAKASLNPFTENMEVEKSEKSAASVKPSQTKPVKPRLGVSSEDETKAALTVSVPPASPFFPSHCSSNADNSCTSKLDPELRTQDLDGVASPSLILSRKHDTKPFIQKLGLESKEQDPECTLSCLPMPATGMKNNPLSPIHEDSQIGDSENSVTSPLYLPPLPRTSVLELHPQPSNVGDPFVSKLEQASGCFHSPPTPLSVPSTVSVQESASSAGSLVESENLHVVPSEKPHHRGLLNWTDPGASSPGSLSGSHPVRFYDRVGLILNTRHDDKEVNVVAPFKENKGTTKKSVTFVLDELKENDSLSSGDEVSDEDSVERCHDENENTIDLAEKNRRQVLELDIEPYSESKFHDGEMSSAHDSGTPLGETEASSPVKVGPPIPAPRALLPSPEETSLSRTVLSSSSPSVPKPAPRNAQNKKRCVTDEAEMVGAAGSASELGLPVDNSVTSSEKLAGARSLTLSVLTDDGTADSSKNINNDNSNYVIDTQSSILVTGELNLKPRALPVILEVGSDDEQLSDYQKDDEKVAVSEDLPRTRDNSAKLWSSIEERGLSCDEITLPVTQDTGLPKTPLIQTLSLGEMSDPDDAFESSKSSVNLRGVQDAGHSIKGSEQKDEDCFTKSRQGDCPEFSKPVPLSPLSNSSELCPASSFPSEILSSNGAESPKNTTVESSDAKVEISGRRKLLQAWVSPSETHPNQTPLSGGTYPAKLRLHPVKPMNTTTNKSPAKTLSTATKILDNQNEASLKKYNPSDPAYAYAQLTHDELIHLVLKQKDVIAKRDVQVRELEDYIDNLLVRVMEETPNILRVQAYTNKKAGKM